MAKPKNTTKQAPAAPAAPAPAAPVSRAECNHNWQPASDLDQVEGDKLRVHQRCLRCREVRSELRPIPEPLTF